MAITTFANDISAVAMGIVKAIYQIAYGSNPDKTFEQSVQFWGL